MCCVFIRGLDGSEILAKVSSPGVPVDMSQFSDRQKVVWDKWTKLLKLIDNLPYENWETYKINIRRTGYKVVAHI